MLDEDQLKIEFGQRLVAARGEMSQGELAARIPVAQKTLGLWERGKRLPEFGYVIRIHELTQVNLNWLATGKGDPRALPLDERLMIDAIQQFIDSDKDVVERINAMLNHYEFLLRSQLKHSILTSRNVIGTATNDRLSEPHPGRSGGKIPRK